MCSVSAKTLESGDGHHPGTLAPGPFEPASPCCRAARQKVRSGRNHASCARRLTDPVAKRAPGRRSSRRAPTRASRGSARSGTHASTSPVGVMEGRSLAECTAMSARPSRTAACTSLTKAPCPPRLVDRNVGETVAGGLDDDELARRRAGPGVEQLRHPGGLPAGQR